MTNNELPSIESLAPLVDCLQEIAHDKLPCPRTLEVRMWEDGDCLIRIFHKVRGDERQQIVYDGEKGRAVWQHLKAPSTRYTEVSEEEGTMAETEYEQKEERQITLDCDLT